MSKSVLLDISPKPSEGPEQRPKRKRIRTKEQDATIEAGEPKTDEQEPLFKKPAAAKRRVQKKPAAQVAEANDEDKEDEGEEESSSSSSSSSEEEEEEEELGE